MRDWPTAKSAMSIISCTSPSPSAMILPFSSETRLPSSSLWSRSSSPSSAHHLAALAAPAPGARPRRLDRRAEHVLVVGRRCAAHPREPKARGRVERFDHRTGIEQAPAVAARPGTGIQFIEPEGCKGFVGSGHKALPLTRGGRILPRRRVKRHRGAPELLLRAARALCSILSHVEVCAIDELAPGELARPRGDPAAEIRRSGRARAGRRLLEPPAADRGVLGDRGAARAAGRGAARRGVPAAGRRLRRELRRLRVGQHRQAAEDPAADEPGAAAGLEEADHPRRPHGRPVRQAALGRHRDPRRRDAAGYRGDLVNRPEFTPEARAPDPELLLRGYERAALTLNFVRALVDGGFADLHHPEYWDLGFLRHAALRDAYQRIVDSIGDVARFLRVA